LPDGQEANRQIGTLMIDNGDEQAGLEWIEQAVTKEPSLEGWVDLGAAYAALGRYDEAITSYQSALKLATDNEGAALANYGIFQAHLETGQVQEALSTWSMVVVLDPSMGSEVSVVYTYLIEQGELDRAQTYLDREPDPIRRTFYEGLIDWQQADESAARNKWRRVLAMDVERENADAAAWMQAALRLGESDKAIDTGNHLLEHPTMLSIEASVMLGIAYAMTDQISRAQRWLEQVRQRLQRGWPSREKIDSRFWHVLTTVVSDPETRESLAEFFDTEAA
jgi:tetratricopeptide (TPR) repeat protein